MTRRPVKYHGRGRAVDIPFPTPEAKAVAEAHARAMLGLRPDEDPLSAEEMFYVPRSMRRPVNLIRRAEALDDDRTERVFVRLLFGIQIASVLLLFAWVGAVIWGVVALVQHITN